MRVTERQWEGEQISLTLEKHNLGPAITNNSLHNFIYLFSSTASHTLSSDISHYCVKCLECGSHTRAVTLDFGGENKGFFVGEIHNMTAAKTEDVSLGYTVWIHTGKKRLKWIDCKILLEIGKINIPLGIKYTSEIAWWNLHKFSSHTLPVSYATTTNWWK